MSNIKNQDTYFFDAQTALNEAKKNKPIDTTNDRIKGLQICYYNADHAIKDAPINCIHVALENVYNYFITTKNRIPTNLSFEGSAYGVNERNELAQAFDQIINIVKKERENLISLYVKEIQNLKPNFKEKPLRVFIPACRETSVMQYISKNIANSFKKLGYDVYYFIQDNAMQGCDTLTFLHSLHSYNPHITININHLNNIMLNESILNFVWFQDSMDIINNDAPLNLRENDYIFALIPGIQNALIKKGAVDTKLQNFCIDTNIYKKELSIKKNRKVVFIGGSYKNNYDPFFSVLGERPIGYMNDENAKLLINELLINYTHNGEFNENIILKLSKKYDKSIDFLISYAIPYVVRDLTLIELSKMTTNYELEIYGWGWEVYEELKPFYKGVLSYGEEISKVYNSAEYAIVAHPSYLIQQRTLESAASNCTPLAYDCRYSHNCTEPYYENSLVLFKNLNELRELLNKDPEKKDLDTLVNDYTYSKFAKKIDKLIKDKSTQSFSLKTKDL